MAHAMNGTLALDEGPLQPTASPLGTALQAAQDGASDAMNAAKRFIPAAGRFLRGAGYGSGYAISYGVVFPAVLIARIVPAENPAGHGLADGARAAIDLARETKAAPAASEPEPRPS